MNSLKNIFPKDYFIRRPTPYLASTIAVFIFSTIIGLAIGSIFIFLAGYSPILIFSDTFLKVFGTRYGILETITKAIPLIFGAYGVAIASESKLWNIGVEGQFLMGVFCSTGVALYFNNLPSYFLLPLMFFAGFLGGGLLALICALPRAFLNVSEILTTLLFNYIVILWIGFFLLGPWKDPNTAVPQTVEIPIAAHLPKIIPSSRLHWGIIIVILCGIGLNFIIKNSVWGYRIRALGESVRASMTAGINLKTNILLVMFISGGLAGLGGMVEVSGILHRMQFGIFPLYTLLAFMVAWIARLNYFGIIIAGFFVAGLLVSGYEMQIMGITAAYINIVIGIILFFIIAIDFLSYWFPNFRKKTI